MTLVEVIDRARFLLNEPLDSTRTFPDDSSSFWTDTQLTGYVNLIQSELQNEIIQTFEDYFVTQTSIDLVNGQGDYSLPTGFMKMRRVEDTRTSLGPTEIRPRSISLRDTVTNFLFTSAALFRDGYYLLGDRIFFHSTPTVSQNSAIRLFYVRRLDDLSDASSISEIPPEYHQAMVWGTVKYALFQQQSDTSKADLEYEKLKVLIRKQAEDRQVQRPRLVKRLSSKGDPHG